MTVLSVLETLTAVLYVLLWFTIMIMAFKQYKCLLVENKRLRSVVCRMTTEIIGLKSDNAWMNSRLDELDV